MQRIGIYGGTFNPPHLGHFRGAFHAKEALGLDKLLMIPDRDAPHKQIPAGSPTPWQRLEMLRLGTAGMEGIEVSDIELRREGKSYTYETVEQLHALYPDAELTLLMGTDMFLSFLSWRNPQRILEHASLAVLYRGQKGEKEAILSHMEKTGLQARLVENPVTAISSTQLRRLLVLGGAGEFLPGSVLTYIREKQLYGVDSQMKNLSEADLEQAVVSLLDPGRVAHVLGCRDAAIELAKLHGADPTDAARAALLHDVTKALDGPLQLTLCREYGMILDDFSTQNPKTLHAFTGSLVAERIFGENKEVVAAIRSHTTGKPAMNTLEKIIYVADYMEPNRNFPGVDRLRHLAYTDLDAAMILGLTMTLAMLKQQGRAISPESQAALAYLENSVKKG